MISKTLGDLFARIEPFPGGLPFSYSRATTLMRCRLQFEHTYRSFNVPRGIPSANDDTRIGSLAHEILECTVAESNATGFLSTTGGNFEGNFNKVLDTADNGFQRSVLLEIKRPMAIVLSELYTKAARGGYVMYPERELRFSRDGTHIPTMKNLGKVKPFGKLGLKGYVDLELKSGDDLLIYDYKTEMPSDERNVSVERQMGLYAFCEFEVRPHLKNITTSVAYLKNHEIRQIAAYTRASDYRNLRDMVVAWFEEYIDALKHYEVTKTKNDYCKYCCFSDYCNSV